MMTQKNRRVHPAIDAKRNPPPYPEEGAGSRPPVGSPLHESAGWIAKSDLADIADEVGAHA